MQEEEQWLNEQIALQCAPLMAGLKPSNLLIIPEAYENRLAKALRGTKIAWYLLTEYDGKQVYLLYKINELLVYLTETDVQKLLQKLGYDGAELFLLLQEISGKYTAHKRENAAFPHELGLLLGYPAMDVQGFIEHDGKDFLYSGYWKVYGNLKETLPLFQQFKMAKHFALHLAKRGYNIADIMAMYYKNKTSRLAAG